MKMMFRITISILSLLLINCATTPTVRSKRPFTRSFTESMSEYNPNRPIQVNVNCEASPFIGSSELVDAEIEDLIVLLLKERNLLIDQNNSFFFKLNVNYRTETLSRMLSTTAVSSSSGSANASSLKTGTASSNTLAIAVASLVSANSSASNNSVITSNTSKEYFKHTIAIELLDRHGKTIYKSDIIWETVTPDIRSELNSNLNYILNTFPRGENLIKNTHQLREDHLDQYFDTYCAYRWFINPVLPYRIRFSHDQYGSASKIAIKNPEALPAVLHLIQSAQVAIPFGYGNYRNATDSRLWSTARLGGRYYIGDSQEPVAVIVDLIGSVSGYTISNCWIATPTEYAKFKAKQIEWESALAEYFNFYE